MNSALQRARGVVLERAEADGADGDERLDAAVERCMGALAHGDVDALIGIASDPAGSEERSWTYSALPAYRSRA